jgi:predicted dehydrogenase
MRILDGTWADDYLDYCMSPQDVRVSVQAYWPLRQLSGLYFEQPRSLRRVWNYIHTYGALTVLRKIRSRWAERLRDTRFLAIGLGTVRGVGKDVPQVQPGQSVIFIAPAHPHCLERIVLSPALMAPAPAELASRLAQPGGILLFQNLPPAAESEPFLSLAGWNPFSGAPMDPPRELLDRTRQMLCVADPRLARVLPLDKPSDVCEVSGSPRNQGRLDGVVFGLGNYAKTVLLPNLDPRINIACIHEVDPTQIDRQSRAKHVFDTSPIPRPDEKYNIYFLAGYHHTHTPLAVHALGQGAWAVIEKPLVTSREQLDQLLAAMREHPGKVFACYHKRYSPLLDLARQDLNVPRGEPVNVSCIVFEMPLPRQHWYRWPNSRTRLTSNGCHWLDQFLFVNDYPPYVETRAWRAHCGDIHTSVQLANGASFNMTLTDIGSRRTGVKDYVELRARDITARIANETYYESEDTRRIIRRKTITKTIVHEHLYKSVSRKILAGESGDSPESVERTHSLVLDLEALLPSGHH